MDYLVLSPPVCTPAEPPSGAFMLAAGLAGHGLSIGFLDLSLAFYHWVLNDPAVPGVNVTQSLSYLINHVGPYQPMRHRTAAGMIHNRLKGFSKRYPGFRLSAMDFVPESSAHNPKQLLQRVRAGELAFFDVFWEDYFNSKWHQLKPQTTLISLAYLSQLPAAISLSEHLKKMNITPIIGGSLPRSLKRTGYGLASLKTVFDKIDTTDGTAFLTTTKAQRSSQHLCQSKAAVSNQAFILDKMAFPQMVVKAPYFSNQPVYPLTLSIGCYWDKCLFCPDRGMGYKSVSMRALDDFLASVPQEAKTLVGGVARPKEPITTIEQATAADQPGLVVHLLDSAMPPGRLRQFLPIAKAHNTKFYGFARPTNQLLKDDLLKQAADAGCLMLQLGVEGGAKGLLDRFDKGLNPSESAAVIQEASQLGIKNYLYLLFGLPGETKADREATLDLVDANAQDIDFLNLSIFNLPKYCELADKASEYQIEMSHYSTDVDAIQLYRPFISNGESNRAAARNFLMDVFLQKPAIRKIHLNTPKWFRAAHMALMAKGT